MIGGLAGDSEGSFTIAPFAMPAPKRAARTIGYTKAALALRKHANLAKAAVFRGYFKDPGNQVFLGVTTPLIRKLAREFMLLPLSDVRRLMQSRVHDEQSLAYAVLRRRFEKGSDVERETTFGFYVRNRGLVRSWDAVDDSAPNIVGPYLLERDKKLLYELARSPRLWDRRIAMVSTLYFIRRGHVSDTLRLAEMLLDDQEDLIHKATGWMLREVGKQDVAALKGFLKTHCAVMPRTMLRYAIERFPQRERIKYLRGLV
jgi:3-methyladenine DNA glycosylase AlkD